MKTSSFQLMYIKDEFENLFKDRFLTSSPRNWGATLDYVNPISTEKQKSLFTSPFSEDEVSVETHQLRYLKALVRMVFQLILQTFRNLVATSVNTTTKCF